MTLEELSQYFSDMGEKTYRAQQVFQWIHQRGVADFAAMTDLSLALREKLSAQCEVFAPEVSEEKRSQDGTIKWLFRLSDNNYIESVFIPEPGRGTLCISSQVGCALNCSFCSTGKQGFSRNLEVFEIIGQLWQARKRIGEQKVTNVVMMGMGEPLLNFEALIPALSMMRHDRAYGLSRRRVTVSTSGVVPDIARLSRQADVSLAVSLHAPNDLLRNELVPLNKKYPIKSLIEACHQYVQDRQSRHITMEYVMLQGINDNEQHARELVRLLGGLSCKLNLIPFNPFPGSGYIRSTDEVIERFRQICVSAKIVTTIRRTRGEDIDAACGQLVGIVNDKTSRQARWQKKISVPMKLTG